MNMSFGKKTVNGSEFHIDGHLFSMLSYLRITEDNSHKYHINKSKDDVLSTEFILYNNNNEQISYNGTTDIMKIIEDNDKIKNALESSKKIFKNIDNAGLRPGLLRFKLRNGDTILWSDFLLRHSAINPRDEIVYRDEIKESVFKFEIPHRHMERYLYDKNFKKIPIQVNVCKKITATTEEDYNGRGTIITYFDILEDGLFYDGSKLNVREYIELDNFNEIIIPYSDIIDEEQTPSINFSDEDLESFFTALSLTPHDSCIPLGSTMIKPRGGKKNRKNKRTRKIKKSRTSRKSRNSRKK